MLNPRKDENKSTKWILWLIIAALAVFALPFAGYFIYKTQCKKKQASSSEICGDASEKAERHVHDATESSNLVKDIDANKNIGKEQEIRGESPKDLISPSTTPSKFREDDVVDDKQKRHVKVAKKTTSVLDEKVEDVDDKTERPSEDGALIGGISETPKVSPQHLSGIDLWINTTHGAVSPLTVPANSTIADVHRIACQRRIIHKTSVLSFAGEELRDHNQTLADVGIGSEAHLHEVTVVHFNASDDSRYTVSDDGIVLKSLNEADTKDIEASLSTTISESGSKHRVKFKVLNYLKTNGEGDRIYLKMSYGNGHCRREFDCDRPMDVESIIDFKSKKWTIIKNDELPDEKDLDQPFDSSDFRLHLIIEGPGGVEIKLLN